MYLANRGIMSVSVEPGPTPRFGQPQLLFTMRNEGENWDMAPDGSRFLVAMRVGEYTPPPFTVLLNWQSALSR